LVRQPKTAVFQAKIEVRIYRTPVLKVLKELTAGSFHVKSPMAKPYPFRI